MSSTKLSLEVTGVRCFLSRSYAMFARPYVCLSCKRSISHLLKRPQIQYIHASPSLALPRRKDFFSSNAYLKQKQQIDNGDPIEFSSDSQKQRRRGNRSPAAPTSLRRVAVEAQRSKDGIHSKALLKEQGLHQTKVNILEYTYFACTDK